MKDRPFLKILIGLTILAIIGVIAVGLTCPIVQIGGSSMADTLQNGELILTVKTTDLKQGDIAVFTVDTVMQVKRVIAKGGQKIQIDASGNVFVDDIYVNEPYAKEKGQGESGIDFPFIVPDGEWFFLNDNRANAADSRSEAIGCMQTGNLIGKAVFKIWPLSAFGSLK